MNQAVSIAPILVAADGGADTALAAGHMPEAVIGDMDSISPDTKRLIPKDKLHHVAEQDSTDFAKCLRSVEAPAILAVGFAGGRLDHQLAACTTLVNFSDRVVILLTEEDLCFAAPRRFRLGLAAGTRVSLYPMGPVTGRSRGLRYPIDGLTLTPATRVGTSNEAEGPIELEFDSRDMLVILPKDQLALVLDELTGTRP